MSGSGKTFWSKQLSARGFISWCCDELIGQKLANEQHIFGSTGTKTVAEWMGQPYEIQYQERSALYLEKEALMMQEILTSVERSRADENIVIDTTGSLIYINENIIRSLKRQVTFVYLCPPASYIDRMIQLYFDDPKPIIWGDAYHRKSGETRLQSIRRCYPALLQYRSTRYQILADKTVNTSVFTRPDFTVDTLLPLLV